MADDVTIRTLNAGDLDEVARVCFPENDPDDIRDRLRDELVMLAEGRGWTLVAECGGAVCGTVHVELSHGRGWVHNVAVCEGRRGQGIAGRLLAEAEGLCRSAGAGSLSLHVRRDNPGACRAYEKAGYRFVAVDGMRGDQLRYRLDL